MHFFQSKKGGILVLTLAILVAVILGQVRKEQYLAPAVSISDSQLANVHVLDTSVDRNAYRNFIQDDAGVLTGDQEDTLTLYDANWDIRYNSLIAVCTVNSLNGQDIQDAVFDFAYDCGVGENDAVLLVSVEDGAYYFDYGEEFSTIMDNKAVETLSGILNKQYDAGHYGAGTVDFFRAMDGIYQKNFGLGTQEGIASGAGSAHEQSQSQDTFAAGVIGLLILLIVMIAILSAIDRARMNSYRTLYYGRGITPPVVFRPILFWHRPGSTWYRRRWTPPPPPPPFPGRRQPGGTFGRGPHPSGGPHPSSHGARPGGSFGGGPSQTPRSGGTFGGRPTGGGHTGGFGGSFGGGSRPSGGHSGSFGGGSHPSGGRSGSFGGGSRPSGGRSGGFGGGSRSSGGRSGGFGGGSRGGGGFGGRR